MTEQKAKQIINAAGYPNVMEVLEAFEVAYAALGYDADLTEIFKWAEGENINHSLEGLELSSRKED